MAYNINLANFFNNLTGQGALGNVSGNGTTGETSSVSSSQMKNVVEQLKSLLVGDIFTGEITDLKGGMLSVKMGNGQLFNANLSAESNVASFQKGELVTFLVSDKTDSQISLKPLDTGAQEMVFAGKALESANLAMNQENLNMIKGLVDLNMPIDKKTLNDVVRLMTKFPDASMDTLLRLYKLDMPVTEENIRQFDAYKSFEHDMSGTMKDIAQDFSSMLSELGSKGDTQTLLGLVKDFTGLFTENEFSNQKERLEPARQELFQYVDKLPEETMKNPESMAKEVFQFVKNQNLSHGETLNLLNELAHKENFPKEALSKMFSSEEFRELFQEVMKDNMFLKPENVADKKEVKEFYNKLLKTVTEGQKILEKASQMDSAMAKGMASVKNSLDFMNDLNHQMAYVQIPIKFQEGEAKGDLYVYTNKKSLAGKNDDLTALLHLDMEHLGPMDVYVKMTGLDVSTNFCLESEEMLDFIYAHIDLLTERLKKKGYNFNPTMTVREEGKKIDFEKDFLDVASPVVPVSRYMFDIKA